MTQVSLMRQVDVDRSFYFLVYPNANADLRSHHSFLRVANLPVSHSNSDNCSIFQLQHHVHEGHTSVSPPGHPSSALGSGSAQQCAGARCLSLTTLCPSVGSQNCQSHAQSRLLLVEFLAPM